jgi:plasmid maintenance system antidote protein VapI
MARSPKMLEPIPPGEVRLKEFMVPHAITAVVALRLGKYFGTTPEMWLNLQADYDLRLARASEWTRIEPRVRVLATGK